MPWGSWITCEETVNGPDVGPDFTGASNVTLDQRHGFVFEVPVGGQSDREPITRAGRFAHESVAFDPHEGALYLTEDNFGFPSGFYRYVPRRNPMRTGQLDNDGRLQMLTVTGAPNIHLEATRSAGRHATRSSGSTSTTRRPRSPTRPARPAPTTERRRASATSATRAGPRAPRTSPGWRGRSTTGASSTSPRPRAAAPRRPAPDTDRTATATGTARSGRTDPRAQQLTARLPVAWPGRPRLPGQRHDEPARHAGRLRGQHQRQLPARADPGGRAVRHRPQPAGQHRAGADRGSTTSSPARPSAPTDDTLFVNIQAGARHDLRDLGPLGPHRRLRQPTDPS